MAVTTTEATPLSLDRIRGGKAGALTESTCFRTLAPVNKKTSFCGDTAQRVGLVEALPKGQPARATFHPAKGQMRDSRGDKRSRALGGSKALIGQRFKRCVFWIRKEFRPVRLLGAGTSPILTCGTAHLLRHRKIEMCLPTAFVRGTC